MSNLELASTIARVDLANSPDILLQQAMANTLCRIGNNHGAFERVTNSLNRRFVPYVMENWVIADQLIRPDYQSFVADTTAFMNGRVGFIVCPDGRIAALALGDPLVMNIHRRLQGMPQTRPSTRIDGGPVLNDSDLAAAITTDIEQRHANGENPEITEFVGPHIYSMEPEEGCGAFKNKAIAKGHTAKLGMRHGGIAEFFAELGDEFDAFNNIANRAGGKGTTIDMVHDAYSEGLIFGLREAVADFDPQRGLRANILELAKQKRILMTERVGLMYAEAAYELASQMGYPGKLDIKNPANFARNAMAIGQIAREITEKQLQNGLEWIPDHLKDGKTETALLSLAYTDIRNGIYRLFGEVKPGNHQLTEHPETILSIGPTSALYNRDNIPFVQKTHHGEIDPTEIANGKVLYNLAGSVMERNGISLEEEGRVILVTGEYNQDIYKDRDTARAELNRVASVTRNNAAKFRDELSESVITGEAVVLGILHEPVTRRIIAVV